VATIMEDAMATAGRKRQQLIERDASDLAFRFSQSVQAELIRRAAKLAGARQPDTVTTADIRAAVAELNLAGGSGPVGGIGDGEESGAAIDAA
jgi:hypothetical protein